MLFPCALRHDATLQDERLPNDTAPVTRKEYVTNFGERPFHALR